VPPIAEFELRVLLTVRRLGEDAYAVAVHEDLEQRSRRRTSQGAVYITLDRLERKGLLGSRMGDPTPERGGRAKRFYRLTRAGLNAVRDEVRLMQRLWDGLDVVSNERS
jgi:DNA-binding PadR family transcriptional regulator